MTFFYILVDQAYSSFQKSCADTMFDHKARALKLKPKPIPALPMALQQEHLLCTPDEH